MSPATPAASPLRDSDLVDFAAQPRSSRKESVIIEARRPPVAPARRVRLAAGADAQLPAPAKARARAAGDAVEAAFGAAMADVEAALARLGLKEAARRNDLSGSFVVEVTPRQLRELAATPSVQAIRCNRRHRRAAA